MGIETLYTCDCCGYKQGTPYATDREEVDFFTIAIILEGHNSVRYLPRVREQSKLWCRRCVDANHVTMPLFAPPDGPQDLEGTFVSLIRKIVDEALDAEKG